MIVIASLLLLALAVIRRKRCVMQPNAFDLDFQRFAFGICFDVIPLDAMAMQVWNARHGDKLTLKPDGKVVQDIIAMWDIYQQWQQQELDQQKTPIEEQVHDEGK